MSRRTVFDMVDGMPYRVGKLAGRKLLLFERWHFEMDRLFESNYVLVLRGGMFDSIGLDRKSTRLNSSHSQISYAVFCLKKKKHRRYDALINISKPHHLLLAALHLFHEPLIPYILLQPHEPLPQSVFPEVGRISV